MKATIPGPRTESEPITAALPAYACDCHAHIFGPAERFPYAEGRRYTPPDAPLEDYLAMLDRLGMARGIVVQGNAHGRDNRAILDALSRAPDRLRGVAIVGGSVDFAELRNWQNLGIRGLRFHVFPADHWGPHARGASLDDFARLQPIMRELDWHMQVFCDPAMLIELAPTLREIARNTPVVIDHMGKCDAARGTNEPSFQTLLRLVGDDACWVKLSGLYITSRNYPDYADAMAMHKALVTANPERLVWGTDWPHTRVDPDKMPDDGHLLNLFLNCTPAEFHKTILSDNPSRLYGFPPSQ